MTGNGHAPEPPAASPPPAITITFSGPGQSDMVVSTTPGVSLSQVMGAAYLLDCVARELRAGEAAKAAMRQLSVGTDGLPPELRKILGV